MDNNKRKILIISEGYFPLSRAGVIITTRICEELAKNGENVAVYITGNSPKNIQYLNEHHGVRILNGNSFNNHTSYHQLKLKLFGQNVFRKVINFILNLFSCDKFDWLSMLKEKKEIVRIIKYGGYEIIISISYPITNHIIAYNIRKNMNIKWIACYLDPYTFNWQLDISRLVSRLKLEKKLLKKADVIMAQSFIFNDFKNCELKYYLQKSVQFELPCIIPIYHLTNSHISRNDSKSINCLFIGTLYYDIRNPEFLFELFVKLNRDINLTIIGNRNCKFPDNYFENWKKILPDRLRIYDRVSLEKAKSAMLNADILINVDNSLTNQMPSKIIDYISSGKPVINICKIRNSPSLFYTNKYPLCLTLFEENGLTLDIIESVEHFCYQYKGKKVDYKLIEKLYISCTPEYVGGQFASIIDDL